MKIAKAKVQEVTNLTGNIYLINLTAPYIAERIQPGQFCNIKTSDTGYPLLRRPFSICDVRGDNIYFMFDKRGEGTKLLAGKFPGESVDILGPLGKGFDLTGDYETAILAAGGLGVAPFPFLTAKLGQNKKILTFTGARTRQDLVEWGLKEQEVSTDDGSEGYTGNVVQLMEHRKEKFINEKCRIFACGPTPMLKSVKIFGAKYGIKTYLSTECAMACGFGICQGCPVDSPEGKYKLVCKDGPVFDSEDIVL